MVQLRNDVELSGEGEVQQGPVVQGMVQWENFTISVEQSSTFDKDEH